MTARQQRKAQHYVTRRDILKAQGKCRKCGINPHTPGGAHCPGCRGMINRVERARRRRQARDRRARREPTAQQWAAILVIVDAGRVRGVKARFLAAKLWRERYGESATSAGSLTRIATKMLKRMAAEGLVVARRGDRWSLSDHAVALVAAAVWGDGDGDTASGRDHVDKRNLESHSGL